MKIFKTAQFDHLEIEPTIHPHQHQHDDDNDFGDDLAPHNLEDDLGGQHFELGGEDSLVGDDIHHLEDGEPVHEDAGNDEIFDGQVPNIELELDLPSPHGEGELPIDIDIDPSAMEGGDPMAGVHVDVDHSAIEHDLDDSNDFDEMSFDGDLDGHVDFDKTNDTQPDHECPDCGFPNNGHLDPSAPKDSMEDFEGEEFPLGHHQL